MQRSAARERSSAQGKSDDSTSDEPPTQRHGAGSSMPPADDATADAGAPDAALSSAALSNADVSRAAGGDPSSEAEGGVYGTGVPYGGDEHTEEIDPVVFDAPFTPDARKTPPAPAVATPKPPAVALSRGFEMNAPAAQMLLSDLFDSVPASGALSPPDPAAFSSSRPPPQHPAAEQGRDAIVALPNISVGSGNMATGHLISGQPHPGHPNPAVPSAVNPGSSGPAGNPTGAGAADATQGSSKPAHPRPEPEAAQRSAPRAAMPTPMPTASAPAAEPQGWRGGAPFETVAHRAHARAPDPEMSTATVRLPIDPEMSTATRRLQPDPEMSTATVRLPIDPEMSTATIKLSRDGVPGAGSSPSHSRPSNAPPRAPMPSSPALGAEPAAGEPAAGAARAQTSDAARFPSEVPTSRPPDVMLSRGPDTAARGSLRPARESKAPLATVTAPASSPFKSQGPSQLPSIMLAADVEAEPDSAARRAMRAGRATVRLELPPGFGRPGSPTSPGAAAGPATATAGFVPSAPPVAYAPAPWFANPRTKRLIGAGLAGLLLFVSLMFALTPRTGSLVVTALAPGNRAVDDVTIFIDGRPLCDVSPCRIKGLSPGVHSLRASAPNLASQAEETVEITAGDEATYNIDLLAVAPEVRSGGMRVPAGERPLTLYLDGKRVGKLPQEVSGLSAGKHWIKLDPEDGSAAIEKSVNVLAGEIVEVEPKPARREKALVSIRLARGSEGAQVTFDDAFLLDFPAELELEPNTVHTLVATKPGYEDLALDVAVAEGETEKLIEVSLTPLEGTRKSRPAKVARKPAPKPAPTTASTALADATQGLLNISSVPPSQIILNGRPLGSTPKTGITVPGDSLQTIVFVHPKMGRRRAQKFVPAGKERTVSIRF